jgi:thioredoxin-related protein
MAAAAQSTAGLPAAGDLAADGAAAKEKRLPVLLFFNRAGCQFCERALREYLTPMQRDPAYANRVIFRQVETNKSNRLVDFGGRSTTHREFAARYKIRLTPTIWFVDGDGNALAEPIVGLPTIDFYGAYLDQSIADSLAKLHAKAP